MIWTTFDLFELECSGGKKVATKSGYMNETRSATDQGIRPLFEKIEKGHYMPYAQPVMAHVFRTKVELVLGIPPAQKATDV